MQGQISHQSSKKWLDCEAHEEILVKLRLKLNHYDTTIFAWLNCGLLCKLFLWPAFAGICFIKYSCGAAGPCGNVSTGVFIQKFMTPADNNKTVLIGKSLFISIHSESITKRPWAATSLAPGLIKI